MELGTDPRLLRRLARHRREVVAPPPSSVAWLRLLTAGFALTALALWLIAGYHGGFHALNGLAPLLPEAAWQNITHLGHSSVALALLLVFARNHPRAVWAGVIAAVIATAASHGLKHWAYTARPPGVLEAEAFHVIGRAWPARGFPSGHTVAAFVFVGVWIAFVRTAAVRWALLLAGVAVGGSRVVVGVHWPVDVLAGAAIGTLAALLGVRVIRHWRWGLRPFGHRVCVTVLALGTLGLFDRINGYPQAQALSVGLAVLALSVAAVDYLGPPLMAQLQRRTAVAPRA